MPVSKRFYAERTDRISRVERGLPYDDLRRFNPDNVFVPLPVLLKDRQEGGDNTIAAFKDVVLANKVAHMLNKDIDKNG